MLLNMSEPMLSPIAMPKNVGGGWIGPVKSLSSMSPMDVDANSMVKVMVITFSCIVTLISVLSHWKSCHMEAYMMTNCQRNQLKETANMNVRCCCTAVLMFPKTCMNPNCTNAVMSKEVGSLGGVGRMCADRLVAANGLFSFVMDCMWKAGPLEADGIWLRDCLEISFMS